jgi:hypothetical protein
MAREAGRPGCATASLARAEELTATASRVRRWVVIEQPGPWGREALVESRLPHPVAHTVRSHARRAGVRVLLARRPGWRDGSATRRVYLARTDRARGWIEQLDVDDPRALLGLDLSALDSEGPPGVGAPGPAAVHLVCTNGRHDPCCADLGRPVVRALARAGTPDVWESSHVGGDRFAANVVSLPTGVYYGRVTPERAAGLLAELGEGRLDLDHYRGRSCWPPLVQAAEIFARRHLDERRLDALHVESARTGGNREHDHDRDRLTAVLRRDGGDRRAPTLIEVQVSRHRDEAERLTCADHGTSAPWRYRLEALTVRG